MATPTDPDTSKRSLWQRLKNWWDRFYARRPNSAQFIMFLIVSNGVTVLQLALMPLFRWIFGFTPLVNTDFQVFPVGTNPDGSTFFVFDYPAGEIPLGAGGLAYFLAVQITILIAQVINFFVQRSVTFRSNSSVWKAASWYAIAYVLITFAASAAQGFYRTPLYTFFIETLGWGSSGETTADVVTMIINAAIQFWIFFPIFKLIFRQVDAAEEDGASDGADRAEDMLEAPTTQAAAVAAAATEQKTTEPPRQEDL